MIIASFYLKRNTHIKKPVNHFLQNLASAHMHESHLALIVTKLRTKLVNALLVIELNSSKAIAGKELVLSSWCIEVNHS